MDIVVLSFDQITFLLKKLNPDAEIRKINKKYDHGENMLFSKIPGDKLIIPFGYHYVKKEGITSKIENTSKFYNTCRIYTHEQAKKMGKILEPDYKKDDKPLITKAYVYKDKNNETAICACYGNLGYRIAKGLDFVNLLIEFGKQKKVNTLKNIIEDNDFIRRVDYSFINDLTSKIIPFDNGIYHNINYTYINLKKDMNNLLKNGATLVKSNTLMGKAKTNNTDSSLIVEHPSNKNIKLLAVADSNISKDITPSVIATSKIKNWFTNLNQQSLNNTNKLIKQLKDAIYNINCTLYNIGYKNNQPGKLTTTLTTAIILEKQTIIAKIGNSNIYRMIDEKIDSILDNENDKKHLLGGYNTYQLNIKTVSNDSYDKLLLLTDGVTYSLSNKAIESISNNAKKVELANDLVDMAIGDYEEKTDYGNDNATAVVYIKK